MQDIYIWNYIKNKHIKEDKLIHYWCIVYHFVFQYRQMKWKNHMLSIFNPLYVYY